MNPNILEALGSIVEARVHANKAVRILNEGPMPDFRAALEQLQYCDRETEVVLARVQRLFNQERERGMKCNECEGAGAVDSGGVTPWMGQINVQCPTCKGKGTVILNPEWVQCGIRDALYEEANGPSPQLNYHNLKACEEMAQRIMRGLF